MLQYTSNTTDTKHEHDLFKHASEKELTENSNNI